MSSDVVPFHPPRSQQSTLEASRDAYAYAKVIADTDFVPKALRGNAPAVLACMMTGHEAGISEMQSLRSIHIVDGRPSMSAELMRALVLRAGHDIWTEEASSTKVVVKAARSERPDRPSSVTWTIDDARRAKLDQKHNWKSYPMAMLEARAVTAICRRMFPDVLAGISHSIEELTDGDVISAEIVSDTSGAPAGSPDPAPATMKAANRAALPSKPDEPEKMADPPRGEAPPLPGEEDIIPAEIVEDTADEVEEPEPVDDDVPPPDDYPVDEEPPGTPGDTGGGPVMSGPQMIAMRFGDLGVTRRDDKLAAVAALIGHDVDTANDLTPAEISSVLEWISENQDVTSLDDVVSRVLAADTPENSPETSTERRSAVSEVASWDEDRWRMHAKTQKLTIPKAIKIAQAVGAEQDPVVKVATLGDLVGSSIGDEVAARMSEGGK